jgi:hypothetical protein
VVGNAAFNTGAARNATTTVDKDIVIRCNITISWQFNFFLKFSVEMSATGIIAQPRTRPYFPYPKYHPQAAVSCA